MKKILVFSDTFSVRLLKGYVEPNFIVKAINHPQALQKEMQEPGRRCIFFDEEHTDLVIKLMAQYNKEG